MKTRHLILLLLVACIYGLQANAQAIKYKYDGAGNRESRSKLIRMASMTKSSTGETGNTDDTETTGEVPKFEEILSEMKVIIYPNPTRGALRVDITGGEIPKDARIAIYNITGALIRQWNNAGATNNIDISGQPAGTYIMHIIFDKNRVSAWKIIKE